MNKTHASGLATVAALQLAAIFADQSTPLAAKLASAAVALLLLIFADPSKQRKALTVALSVAGIAVPVLGFVLTKMHPGALAANVASIALAVFVRLPALLPVPTKADDVTPAVQPNPPAIDTTKPAA